MANIVRLIIRPYELNKMGSFSADSEADLLGKDIGKALKDGGVDLALFGDSPIEEQSRPEIDMIEDDVQIRELIGKKNRVVEAEPLGGKVPEDFRNMLADSNFDQDYTVDFCIDGSLRTKYMGELIAGGSGAPFVVSHVGAAAVKIDYDHHKALLYKIALKLAIYMPGPGTIPDATYQQIEMAAKKYRNVHVESLPPEETVGELRSAAGGKVRNMMHEVELSMIDGLPEGRRYVALDGGLQKQTFYKLEKTIAIAKGFSHKVIFLGNDGKVPRTISYLSRLRVGFRTPVFRYRVIQDSKSDKSEGDLSRSVFWYLKIRAPPPEMEPLGGIVKVGLPYNGESDSEIEKAADQLSKAVLRISNPSTFPRPRWPSFIYPIRVAESYLSTCLYNANYFVKLGVTIRRGMV